MAGARLKIWICRLIVLAVFLGAWQIAAGHSKLTQFFFGSPLGVGHTIVAWFSSGVIYPNLAITLVETVLAFAIGAGLALVVGLWLALAPFWSGVFDPFIKAVNTMPRLILAPKATPSVLPNPAPTARDGANKPPGMPETVEAKVATNLATNKSEGSGAPSTAPRAWW